MIRNRTIQEAAALLFLLLTFLGGVGLSARDGLADDSSNPKGEDVAKNDGGPASAKKGAPARRAPTRKAAPAKKAAPVAKDAPPPSENPELDREILDALGRGPFGGPAGQNFFQGQIIVNGQARRFGNQPNFNNAAGPMPRMGFPAPGMPMNGMGMPGMFPGMPFNRVQGNFVAPALGGTRVTPKNPAATQKRRTMATGKANPKPATTPAKGATDDPGPPPPD